MTTCYYCGEDLVLDLFEVWEGRDFMLETCCGAQHEGILQDVTDRDEETFAELEELIGSYGFDVRRLYVTDCGHLRIDAGLELVDVEQRVAKDFVRQHHAHHAPGEQNRPPAGWRWGHAIVNAGDLVAVAMVGRPIARRIDASKVVEVNRLCVSRDLDPALVWNAASMLYGAAAREARRRGFESIVTYTLEHEAGTSLRAAGWLQEHTTAGGSWNRPSRAREDHAPTCPKVRWTRRLAALDQNVLITVRYT